MVVYIEKSAGTTWSDVSDGMSPVFVVFDRDELSVQKYNVDGLLYSSMMRKWFYAYARRMLSR